MITRAGNLTCIKTRLRGLDEGSVGGQIFCALALTKITVQRDMCLFSKVAFLFGSGSQQCFPVMSKK